MDVALLIAKYNTYQFDKILFRENLISQHVFQICLRLIHIHSKLADEILVILDHLFTGL